MLFIYHYPTSADFSCLISSDPPIKLCLPPIVASCYSITQSCPTLWSPLDCNMSGLHYLPEFVQTHDYWVDDAIQPSHPLSPLHLLPSVFKGIKVMPTFHGAEQVPPPSSPAPTLFPLPGSLSSCLFTWLLTSGLLGKRFANFHVHTNHLEIWLKDGFVSVRPGWAQDAVFLMITSGWWQQSARWHSA